MTSPLIVMTSQSSSKMVHTRWTANDDYNLVQLVEQNACLYNIQLHQYRDKVLKDNIWTAIAARLGRDVKCCRDQWKSIRDKYTREKKKLKRPSGDEGKVIEKWPLYTHLGFLERFISTCRSDSNVMASQTNQDGNPLQTCQEALAILTAPNNDASSDESAQPVQESKCLRLSTFTMSNNSNLLLALPSLSPLLVTVESTSSTSSLSSSSPSAGLCNRRGSTPSPSDLFMARQESPSPTTFIASNRRGNTFKRSAAVVEDDLNAEVRGWMKRAVTVLESRSPNDYAFATYLSK